MKDAVQDVPSEARTLDGVHLGAFLQANEPAIRWQIESLILEQMIRAIGRENLDRVKLIFEGSFLGDLTVYVEGPPDLKAKVEEALRTPSCNVFRSGR
jgi:hypothetical protein